MVTLLFTGDNTTVNTYLWGAMLTQTNALTQYTQTIASAVNNGQVRGITAQQQNLLKYSEDFTQSGTWTQVAISSVSANTIANPINGLVNVSGLVATNVNTTHNIQQVITYTLGLTYTFSVYVKAGNQNWLLIEGNNNGTFYCYFNITSGSGAIGSLAGVIPTIKTLPNGWFLCTITYTPTVATCNPSIWSATANGNAIFTGDNATINTYVYGAMLTQSNGLTEYAQTTSSTINNGSIRVLT